MVSQFVQVLLAVALEIIVNLINDLWVSAMSLAADASTHMGVLHMDQRICICVYGVLYHLYLFLVPFFERHTTANYVKLIMFLLDKLSPIWRDKVILISFDGKNTMTGRHRAVVTLLEHHCSDPFLHIWCVPQQLDIVVKTATHAVLDEAF